MTPHMPATDHDLAHEGQFKGISGNVGSRHNGFNPKGRSVRKELWR